MSTIPRTKNSHDKFGDKNIAWLPDLHTIDEIITENSLPVLAKVVHGCKALSVHGHRCMKKFIAIDQKERKMEIPITCKYEAMVRPNVTIPLCKTVGDVCRQPKLPNFVMNEIEFHTHGKIFPAFTTFSVTSASKSGTLSVVCLMQNGYETKLPASTEGHFRETVHPHDIDKRYLMKDLVNRELPLSIEFHPHRRDSIIYSPNLGTIHLKQLTTNDIVYATTYENERRLLITFSRALDIKFHIGHVMIEADGELYSTIAEPTEDEIDEKVLDHALHLNPYNADYIGIDYDVAMQQLYTDRGKGPSVNLSCNENVLTVERVHETKAPDLPERLSTSRQKPPKVPPRK